MKRIEGHNGRITKEIFLKVVKCLNSEKPLHGNCVDVADAVANFMTKLHF